MVRLPDATKLLAIGLLNLADDEGFFHADPRMVRAALRPLDEDSTIVRGALEGLSIMGYVEIRDHPSYGPIGRVVGFGKHQRIDRPSPSKIRSLFDAGSSQTPETQQAKLFDDGSSNARRVIDDRSALEGKGKEGKGMNTPVVPLQGTKGPLQLRAERLMNRRPDTPLTAAEDRAFKKNKAAITATTEADWEALEAYYRAPQAETFSRKDLAALVNNWNGEIDRARKWAVEKQTAKCESGKPPSLWELEKRETAIREQMRDYTEGHKGQRYVGMDEPGRTTPYEWTEEGKAAYAALKQDLEAIRKQIATIPAA